VTGDLVFTIRCVPPSVTAQMKRMVVRGGRPRFFHDARMKREVGTWAALLRPHQPRTPIDGPVELTIRMVYPHLQRTPARDRPQLIPKVSKPDASNAAKHLEDILVKMRFIGDDQDVARLTVEKWHGPEERVGIAIVIRHMTEGDVDGAHR
jgi:Holliday junction resolvase RusA-like endonuclease